MADELARRRRELPWLAIEKEYRFDAADGTRTLAELFDGRSQLVIYHFMFGPSYEVGCPTCSSMADGMDGLLPHLQARDLTLAFVSRAPIEKIRAYRQRMAWSIPWVSSANTDFSFDMGASVPEEQVREEMPPEDELSPIERHLASASGTEPAAYMAELPTTSVFKLEDGAVYRTYATNFRGVEFLMPYYAILDRAPKGRDEGEEFQTWIRRHDEYAWQKRGSAVRERGGTEHEVKNFDPKTSFGYEVSKRYDAEEVRGDEEDTVAFLAGLAGEGTALELAVGTGRIALPLVRAGVPVDGIELSQDMVDRMREKPDGDKVAVTMGDMSTVTTGRAYGLVYLIYNTIGNLLTQDDQVRCFENAARHLAVDGVFVLECRVPVAPTWPGGGHVAAERIEVDEVVLDVGRYDRLTQILDENHVRVGSDGVQFDPIRLRLAHPPEFDLMARIAGLRLRERWGGWNGEPFTATSWRHISVYQPEEAS